MRSDWRHRIVLSTRQAAQTVAPAVVMLAAMTLACPAHAQDAGGVGDYRLPPAASPAAKPAEGPVDADHPVATPTRPAPDASPTPGDSAAAPATTAPTIVPPATRKPAPAAQPAPAAPSASPSAQTPDGASRAVPPPGAIGPAAPVEASPPPAAPAQPEERAGRDRAAIAGTGIALAIAALAALLWLRRRKAARDHAPAPEETWPDPEAIPAAAPSAPATLPRVSAAIPRPPLPAPPPVLSADDSALALQLELASLRLSFVYATLAYRLTVTNRDAAPWTNLTIAGDLVSGHASVPPARQLSLDPGQLAALHRAGPIAPGESVAFDGALQLPLAEILPLRAGTAALFAPLARFRIERDGDGRPAIAHDHVFTVGLPGARSDRTMQPFRLDLGPQFFRDIVGHEIDVAHWLRSAEARRAG